MIASEVRHRRSHGGGAFVTAVCSYAGLLACIGLALMSPRAARGVEAQKPHTGPAIETPLIPPGQEALFAAMLGRGATLPEACGFVTGQIERAVVRGVYKCPGGEVVIELRHPSAAPADAVRTQKIAIVTAGGTPPAALVTALEERIRQRESGFEWLRPKTTETAPKRPPGNRSQSDPRSDSRTTSGSYVPDAYPRFAAVLVAIAQTMVIVLGLGCGLVRLYRTPSSPRAE